MNCRIHNDRPIDPRDCGDRFCTECYMNAWNAGARRADAEWADRVVNEDVVVHEHGEGQTQSGVAWKTRIYRQSTRIK